MFHVGERLFFGSLQERNPVFLQNRFYVGKVRRLTKISPVFWKIWIFSDFFGFFQKITFCRLSALLPKMQWNHLNKNRNIFSVTWKKIISRKSFLDKNKNVQSEISTNFCFTPFFKLLYVGIPNPLIPSLVVCSS